MGRPGAVRGAGEGDGSLPREGEGLGVTQVSSGVRDDRGTGRAGLVPAQALLTQREGSRRTNVRPFGGGVKGLRGGGCSLLNHGCRGTVGRCALRERYQAYQAQALPSFYADGRAGYQSAGTEN